MKKRKHIVPIGFFCAVFLLFAIYFVTFVQNPAQTDIYGEKAKTFKVLTEVLPDTEQIAIGNKKKVKEFFSKIDPVSDKEKEDAKQIRKMFVNFSFLNLRAQPISTSALIGKLNRNDSLEVLEFTNINWAHVKVLESSGVPAGADGYVAKRYLAAEKLAAPYTQTVDIPNLVYAHVSNNKQSFQDDQVLPVKNLIAQLDYLVENQVETLTYTDLQSIKDGERAIPTDAVLLTFDGGFSDHYAVFKLLKSKNVKATFMIPTASIGTEGHLSWHQMREMKEGGMEIGSMGRNIMYYGNATNDLINTEVTLSKQALEEGLKSKVIVFAFPRGSYLRRAETFLKDAGYLFARTTIPATQFDLAFEYKVPGLRVYPSAATNQLKAWGIGL